MIWWSFLLQHSMGLNPIVVGTWIFQILCTEGLGRQRECELLSEAMPHEAPKMSGSQILFVQKQFPFPLPRGCWLSCLCFCCGFC